MGFTEKYDIQGRGIHEKPILRGRLPKKKGELGQFSHLREGCLARIKGMLLRRG